MPNLLFQHHLSHIYHYIQKIQIWYAIAVDEYSELNTSVAKFGENNCKILDNGTFLGVLCNNN